MIKISKILAQQIVDTVKDLCGYDINFIDNNGHIYASTLLERIGNFHEVGYEVARSVTTREVDEDDTFHGTKKGINSPILYNGKCIAVIGISGNPEEVRKYLYLAQRITGMLIREQELEAISKSQADKAKYTLHHLIEEQSQFSNHFKQCLKEFDISLEEQYKIIILKTIHSTHIDSSYLEQKLTQLFDELGLTLYTFDYPNTHIALISSSLFMQTMHSIKHFTETYHPSVKAGIGSLQKIKDMHLSYQSALLALNTLHQPGLANIESLDLELLLYGVDKQNKQHLLDKTLHKLTNDDIELLKVYYESDMSLNKTSQILFMHKNTLQYKLDRITKQCGYNPRHFKEATVLYYALLLL